jgi:endonuclease-3
MKDEKKELKKRSLRIVKKLKELFPNAKIVLKYRNNWELLVSVILSAQCTDKKVNEVTKKLFLKYRILNDYIKASQAEFEQDIKPTGFYHAKTKNILGAAKMLKERFEGKIPKTMQEILKLPGVARKTANVVLGNAYGVVDGIAVDTHVMRFAQKLELTIYKDPVKIERDLMGLVLKKDWFFLTYGLIEYGRHICVRRKHECKDHPLTKIYPRAATIWP